MSWSFSMMLEALGYFVGSASRILDAGKAVRQSEDVARELHANGSIAVPVFARRTSKALSV